MMCEFIGAVWGFFFYVKNTDLCNAQRQGNKTALSKLLIYYLNFEKCNNSSGITETTNMETFIRSYYS